MIILSFRPHFLLLDSKGSTSSFDRKRREYPKFISWCGEGEALLFQVAVFCTMTSEGRQGFIYVKVTVHGNGGEPRQELEQRSWRNAGHWLAPSGSLSYVPHAAQAHLDIEGWQCL